MTLTVVMPRLSKPHLMRALTWPMKSEGKVGELQKMIGAPLSNWSQSPPTYKSIISDRTLSKDELQYFIIGDVGDARYDGGGEFFWKALPKED